jgi:hypothetical protein
LVFEKESQEKLHHHWKHSREEPALKSQKIVSLNFNQSILVKVMQVKFIDPAKGYSETKELDKPINSIVINW